MGQHFNTGNDLNSPITNTRAGRVNFVFYAIGWLGVKLLGWKVDPQIPPFNKFVAIVAPHTSYWDWPIGLLISLVLRIKGHYLIKHSVYTTPFWWLFKFFGGIPVVREAPQGRVRQAVAAFEKSEVMALALAPEGTTNPTDHWRTGFYQIALQANVPIVFGYLDYARKQGGIGGWFMPTGNEAEDLNRIRQFYDTITPRNPDQRSPIHFSPQNTP